MSRSRVGRGNGNSFWLFKVNETVVTRVTGFVEPPPPLFRGIEGLTGHLPIEQVGFFCLVPIGFYAEVSVLFADPLHFTQGLVQGVAMEVVQGVQRIYEVE